MNEIGSERGAGEQGSGGSPRRSRRSIDGPGQGKARPRLSSGTGEGRAAAGVTRTSTKAVDPWPAVSEQGRRSMIAGSGTS